MPFDRHFRDLDTGTRADNRAIASKDGRCGSRLCEHEHFNVENPALCVHIGHDVREGRAGKELEAALSVADAGRGGRSEDGEDEMEASHEEISKKRTLIVDEQKTKNQDEAVSCLGA